MATIKNLTDVEEKAVRHFLSLLMETFGDDYRYSLMFGSKARGTYHANSDIDLAVVMKQVNFTKKCAIYDLAADEMLATEVEISPLVFSEEDFLLKKREGSPILREIERDMVTV